MREELALRSFAPIVVFATFGLLLSTPAEAQTPPPSETQPSVSSASNDAPPALIDALRREEVPLAFLESPRLDPQARAALMRSLRQYFPAGRVVREEEADVVIAIGVFLHGLPGAPHSGVVVPEAGEEKKAAARKPFQVLVFRRAAPTETVVLYESASVARGGVSQRTGLDKRRAALDLAMKNLGVVAASAPGEKK